LIVVQSCAQSQGRRHQFEGAGGGGVNALEGVGVNTVKTLKFEKGAGCMTPPAPIGCAAPVDKE